MNPADRQQILRLIAESDAALVGAAAGVSNEDARRRPEPERWSVLECVEHVILGDDAMFARVSAHSTPGAPPGERREELILRGMTNRERKFAAPELARPTGRFSSLLEAIEVFRQRRARSTAYVEQYREDPRSRTTQHPGLEPISCHEMFLALALHPARHALQIREVRLNLGVE
jgi:DinB superfamily